MVTLTAQNFLSGNVWTSIHINTHSDMWAHCLELLMHTLAVSPPTQCSPPILPCLVWFIYSFVFQCLHSIFVHPLINYSLLLLSCSVSRMASLFTVPDIPLSGCVAASLRSLSNFLPEIQSFPVFPPWMAFDTKRLCQKWDQSDECGSETFSDFFDGWIGPKRGSTHRQGWGWELDDRED